VIICIESRKSAFKDFKSTYHFLKKELKVVGNAPIIVRKNDKNPVFKKIYTFFRKKTSKSI